MKTPIKMIYCLKSGGLSPNSDFCDGSKLHFCRMIHIIIWIVFLSVQALIRHFISMKEGVKADEPEYGNAVCI